MSKQTSNNKQMAMPSPAAQVAAAEAVLEQLGQKRDECAERATAYTQARTNLSYRAHVGLDVEAGKELAEARDAALAAERELTEIDSALAVAQHRLAEARAMQARAERREEIKGQRERAEQFRELGPFLDRSVENLRKGMIALQGNAASVGRDHRHVQALYRVLQVACHGTVLQEVVGVPDHDTRRNFATFGGVLNQWVDVFEANLVQELERLDQFDGAQQTNNTTEAA
jgi:hypothetical protein